MPEPIRYDRKPTPKPTAPVDKPRPTCAACGDTRVSSSGRPCVPCQKNGLTK